MKRPILVQGTLRLESEGHRLSVTFDDDLIRIDSPRLWDLRAWANALRNSRASRSGQVDQKSKSKSKSKSKAHTHDESNAQKSPPLAAVDHWVRKAGLRIEVCIAGQRIARLGGEAKPTRASRWLGLSPMEVEAGPLVWSLFKW